MAEILSRERRLRDRNTQLLVPGKSFKRVLDFLEHAQVRSKDLVCLSVFGNACERCVSSEASAALFAVPHEIPRKHIWHTEWVDYLGNHLNSVTSVLLHRNG